MAIGGGLIFREHEGFLQSFQHVTLRKNRPHRYPRHDATSSESAMPQYPSGTVAFLFTDVEGSTALWERNRAAMATAVERHFALLREATAAQDGVLFKTIGDAIQAAFPTV